MIVNISLWNEKVGAVLWEKGSGLAVVEFAPSFLKKNLDLAPLTMPLKNLLKGKRIYSFAQLNQETYKGLPGLLADSLPDKYGNALIDAWLLQKGLPIESFTPVDRLCYIGNRGMGALEYEPSILSKNESSFNVNIGEMVDLVNSVMERKKELHTNLINNKNEAVLKILQIGTSAAGARPKAVIALNDNSGEIRSGSLIAPEGFSHWIIKLDGVSSDSLGESKGFGNIEYAYSKMAKDAGIRMSDCLLLEENNRSHFLTRRFDRQGNQKLHMQSLCAIAHYDFNDPNLYTYEHAFSVMRQLKLDYAQSEQLFRVMAFNVMANNCDYHTRNISFLMNPQGKWSLSPAYDLTYAYDQNNIWLRRHQLSVNGKREIITFRDMLQLARTVNITGAEKILIHIKQVVSEWIGYAKSSGVNIKNQIAINNQINNTLMVLENKSQHYISSEIVTSIKKEKNKGLSI